MSVESMIEETGALSVGQIQLGSWRIRLEREPLAASRIRAAYQGIASKWGRTVRRLRVAEAYKRLFSELPGFQIISAGGTPLSILDCGVGAGDFSLALAESVGENLAVTGIDVSPDMLHEASTRLGSMAKTDFREADIRHLPFANDQFDVVLAAHVLEHLPDPETALSEMIRVLKPGGRAVICLTRRSLFGLYVHLLWRTQFRPRTWWLSLIGNQAGTEIVATKEDINGYFARMSFAILMVKSRH